MPVFKNTWGEKKVTLLCHSLISINKVREKLQLGMEQEMGGFKVIMLLSLTALIQTPMAQQEVCEPKSASSFAVLPLSSFALVQIAFFNYRHRGNAACCLLFGNDAQRELLSIVYHKLQTTAEE